MDSIKRAIRFQNYNLIKSLLSFWGVLLIVNIFAGTLIIYSDTIKGPLIIQNDTTSMTASNIMPILIFFIIYGILMYHEDFALALSFGVTRKDFYKSVLVNNIFVVFSFAIIQTTLQMIEKFAVRFFDYNLMVEFGLFNTSTDNVFYIIFSLSMIFLTFVSITNLLGVLQYRFGYKFWLGFGVVVFLGSNNNMFFIKAMGGFSHIYKWTWSNFNNLTLFLLGFIIVIISYALGYIFIRKTNIKKI